VRSRSEVLTVTTLIALVSILAAPAAGSNAVIQPQKAVASHAHEHASASAVIQAQFMVTPSCTFETPASRYPVSPQNHRRGQAGTLVEMDVSLHYFCDDGPDDQGDAAPQAPALAVVDEAETGSGAFMLSGLVASRHVAYSMCPAEAYGDGSCSAKYPNSQKPSALLRASASVEVASLVGYFRTTALPQSMGSFGDDLTAVVYF
jgi:hypothetical protein